MTTPYLSIVVTSRNDNHGLNLRPRMQAFFSALLEQCQRYRLDAEIILVEWNPPSDRPRLSSELTWPVICENCTVRVIEVPSAVHQQFAHAGVIPLFQMIAKNVGIRRARGEFVLATNVDLLFSEPLMEFLAARSLEHNQYYRVDRLDVNSNVALVPGVQSQLDACHDNIIRLYSRNQTLNPNSNSAYPIYPVTHVTGWKHFVSLLRASRSSARNIGLQARKQRGSIIRNSAELALARFRRLRLPRLYTNASGDFTLMARRHWFDLQGYPEFETHALYLDALLLYAAHYNEISEHDLPLPMCVYHIEHGAGWTPEAAKENGLSPSTPHLSYEQFIRYIIDIKHGNRPFRFNDHNWGLGNLVLSETTLVSSKRS